MDHAHQGIRVNAVCPNPVNTPMIRTGFEVRGLDADKAVAELNASVPLGRIAQPEDIAVDHRVNGVRCNAVAPGWIDTVLNIDFIESLRDPARFRKEIGGIHPVGRNSKPEEVGALVAWLRPDEAGFVTGQIWTVDDGRMAKLSLPLRSNTCLATLAPLRETSCCLRRVPRSRLGPRSQLIGESSARGLQSWPQRGDWTSFAPATASLYWTPYVSGQDPQGETQTS